MNRNFHLNPDYFPTKPVYAPNDRTNYSFVNSSLPDFSMDYSHNKENESYTMDFFTEGRMDTYNSDYNDKKSILNSVMQNGQLLTTLHKIKPHEFSQHSNVNILQPRQRREKSVNTSAVDQSFKAKRPPHFEIPFLVYKSKKPLTVPKEFRLSFHK